MKLVYSAAVLTDEAREKLLHFVLPGDRYKHVVAHHCTIQFKPDELPSRLGEQVTLRVLAVASNEKCMAVVVAGVDSANYFPHITIGHSDDVKPVYSNVMLREVSWTPILGTLELDARIGVFTEGRMVFEKEAA